MWCENVRSVAQWNIAGELLQHFGDSASYFVSVVEAALSIFHLASKVRAGVEPKPCVVLGLVA